MGTHVAGDVVHGYRIVGTLGRGGLGTTFEAETEATGERVALKRLAIAGASDWKHIELFEREARVLERLEHPGIPRYLAHFTVEGEGGPALYIAEELVLGESLAQVVRAATTPLGETEIRRIAGEVLGVLDYLGRLVPPVIHRDIKPENVLRRPDGRIALVDFGAARADAARPEGGSTTVGTYGYMAPEQLHGVASPATDVYGLGCTLLFLLTGRSPADLPRKKLRIDVRAAASGVTAPFALWLEKALEPAAEDRFPSAASALAALRGLPGGGGPRVDLSGAPVRRVRPLTLALLAALVCATSFAGWLFAKRGAFRNFHRPGAAAAGPLPARWTERRVTKPVTFIRWWGAHMSAVFSVAISPTGDRIASGSNDGTVKLWDPATGDPVRPLPGHTGRVGGVAWSPDGKLVASAGDATVLVQEATTTRTLLTLHTEAQATSVDFAPDGKVIAAGSLDGAVHIWAVDGGAPMHKLANAGRVLSVRFSPDGRSLAVAAGDTIRIWDAATGTARESLKGHRGDVDAVAWAPDGRILASVGDDHTLRVWLGAKQLLSVDEAKDELWSVAIDPRGKYVATAGKEGTLRVYEAMSGTLAASRELEPKGMLSLAWGPDGTTIVTGDGAGRVGVFSMNPAKELEVPPIPTHFAELPADAPQDRVLFERVMTMIDETPGQPLTGAEKLLRDGIAADGSSALLLVGLSRIAMKRGYVQGKEHKKESLDEADEIVGRALAIAPKLSEAHTQRAWVYFFRKDDAHAKEEAETASRLAPTGRNENILAEIAYRAHDVGSADAHALRAIAMERRSELEATYGTLERIYQWKSAYDAEETALERIATLEPRGAWPRGNLASALVRHGHDDRGIEMAEAALKLMDYPFAHQVIARAYFEKGGDALWGSESAPDIAKADFDKAVAESPTYAPAHYGLGAYFRKLAVERHDKRFLAQSNDELEKAIRDDKTFAPAKVAREENDGLSL